MPRRKTAERLALTESKINRKKKLIKESHWPVYRNEPDNFYSKNKIHCSCPICAKKTNPRRNRMSYGFKHGEQKQFDKTLYVEDFDYSDDMKHDLFQKRTMNKSVAKSGGLRTNNKNLDYQEYENLINRKVYYLWDKDNGWEEYDCKFSMCDWVILEKDKADLKPKMDYIIGIVVYSPPHKAPTIKYLLKYDSNEYYDFELCKSK